MESSPFGHLVVDEEDADPLGFDLGDAYAVEEELEVEEVEEVAEEEVPVAEEEAPVAEKPFAEVPVSKPVAPLVDPLQEAPSAEEESSPDVSPRRSKPVASLPSSSTATSSPTPKRTNVCGQITTFTKPPRAPLLENASEFWDDLNDWLDNVPKISFVLVDDPVQDSRSLTNLSPPTRFRVRSSHFSERFEVRRRYSDFEAVRSKLMDRYRGRILPALPNKKFNNKSDDFLAKRAKGLTDWLASVVKDSFLRADTMLMGFLTFQDSKWQQVRAGFDKSGGVNSAFERYTSAVALYELKMDTVEFRIEQVSESLESLDLVLRSLEESSFRWVAASRAQVAAAIEFSQVFDSSLGAAKKRTGVSDAASSLNGKESSSSMLLEGLSFVSRLFRRWSYAQKVEPCMLEKLVVREVANRRSRLAEAKNVLHRRRLLSKEATKKLAELHSLEVELEQAKRVNRDTSRLDVAIPSAKTKVSFAEQALLTFTKAIFFSNIENFASNEVLDFKNAIQDLAAVRRALEKSMNDRFAEALGGENEVDRLLLKELESEAKVKCVLGRDDDDGVGRSTSI